jgi:hypothetical protein
LEILQQDYQAALLDKKRVEDQLKANEEALQIENRKLLAVEVLQAYVILQIAIVLEIYSLM